MGLGGTHVWFDHRASGGEGGANVGGFQKYRRVGVEGLPLGWGDSKYVIMSGEI
jgi:hypothetical protein